MKFPTGQNDAPGADRNRRAYLAGHDAGWDAHAAFAAFAAADPANDDDGGVDVERLIAETLCPPSHREGMVTRIIGQRAKFGPRRVCTMHDVAAKNVTRVLVAARIIPPGKSIE